jgi:hypothetical protein
MMPFGGWQSQRQAISGRRTLKNDGKTLLARVFPFFVHIFDGWLVDH